MVVGGLLGLASIYCSTCSDLAAGRLKGGPNARAKGLAPTATGSHVLFVPESACLDASTSFHLSQQMLRCCCADMQFTAHRRC